MRLANHNRIALLSAKMRWKVGSIVLRSRSVSLTSTTIRGGVAMFASCCPHLEFTGVSMLVPEPAAVRGLFGAITADRHAAPSSRPHPRMVGKYQRAPVSFTSFHAGEILFTHKLRQRFANRQQ